MSHLNDAVLNSRAGDRFHYLWAARRCLLMIHPLSQVQEITVEGSPEPDAAGELVIDVGERCVGSDGRAIAHYYQLKHTVVRKTKPMSLAELAKTLAGFAARFAERPAKGIPVLAERRFSLISNRPVSDAIKEAVEHIAKGKNAPAAMRQKLETATKLKGTRLKEFFARLLFSDNEGDYIRQEQELRTEMSRYNAGTLERSATLELVGLVSDQALPQRKGQRTRGRILPEDVLKVFGVSHPEELFPARSAMESLSKAFGREQHARIIESIAKGQGQIIIHAAGGVGKSVVAQQLAAAFPKGSETVVYDCFGGGTYMNQSRSRHRPCDGLMQIANELAVKGLCQVLIARPHTPTSEVLRTFLRRLHEASDAVKQRSTKALLVVMIDAADNAEMAAEAFNDDCFAHLLIRESLPSNCRIVFLCRTERRELLKPTSRVIQIELKGFSLAESTKHLKSRFLTATNGEAKEFHRLTGGNPRVQATCLSFAKTSVRDMLDLLGPGRVTVDEQIEGQLDAAVSRLKDQHPHLLGAQVESICRGLATLPPFIPLKVLAAAANVEQEAIKSLIADLGRPLWCTDDSVQFRDEPTETWFKNRFAGTPDDIRRYARALEPLAATFTYAARTLPALWHQAGEHYRLIQLALSDEYLPENNPIDAREVRVYRLQYALKAALRIKALAAAAKLAMRAGEEMAGNQRQLSLFRDNLDLLSTLQAPHIVQEWAHKRQIRATWRGSENIYSASLLAGHRDFHGEARSYLHHAGHWLQLYFEERDKLSKQCEELNQHHFEDALKREHIAELGWASLNLEGPKGFCGYITNWRPPNAIYESARIVVRRMIDAGRFDELDAIARSGSKSVPLILAICIELSKVSKFPPKSSLQSSLDQLSSGKFAMEKDSHHSFQETVTSAVMAFAEACAAHGLASNKVIATLATGPSKPPAVYDIISDYEERSRQCYARAIALVSVLGSMPLPNVKELLPDPPQESKPSHHDTDRIANARTILRVLLPLYELRQRLIVRGPGWRELSLQSLNNNQALTNSNPSGYHSGTRMDVFWDELPLERLRIVALQSHPTSDDLTNLRGSLSPQNDRRISRRIEMTRICYRHPPLVAFGVETENAARAMMEAIKSPEPDEKVELLTALARAVLFHSKADASAYYEQAVEQTSKFGDELTERWEGMCSLARRGSADGASGAELAYRYFRCAELVGVSVAREKYWNRGDVFRVLLKMHAPSAFTAFSRWRDRDIGRQDALMEALSTECAKLADINAAAAFCLSGFAGAHASRELLEPCLERESDHASRQRVLDQCIGDLYRQGTLLSEASGLRQLAERLRLNADLLTERCEQAKRIRTPGIETLERPRTSCSSSADSEKGDQYGHLLQGLDLTSAVGIGRACTAFDGIFGPRDFRAFWGEIFDQIPTGKEVVFMKSVLEVEQMDYIDTIEVVSRVNGSWRDKASVRRHWETFLKGVGKKLHASLAERGGIRYLVQSCSLDEGDVHPIHAGLCEGIEARPSLLHSGALFGFVSVVAKRLTPAESMDVLDYALQRIEMHLPEGFGDGPWASWLNPPAAVLNAFTGMIWAALGAPHSSTRWEAAHCVRRLVELGCAKEIASLLAWIDSGEASAFLARGCPFYKLHAILYLLFGLSRGSLNDVSLLLPHMEVFVRFALDSTPHALIQPEAAKLALRIESSCPGTLEVATVARLEAVGVSPFLELVGENDELVTSPWHRDSSKTWPSKPHFAMDIDAYWLPRLARVFRISSKELDQLMKENAVSCLGVNRDDDYLRDPRQPLWNSYGYSGRSTHHSHGSYPHIDSYSFYIAYQAYMIVAARLLRTMPVVRREGNYFDEPDRWTYWLSSHRLARADGRWMSDRRDPTLPPRKSPDYSRQSQYWRWSLTAADFFDVLTTQASIPGGLCIGGSWSDAHNDLEERIHVDCALVRPEMASSLANAIRTADEPECASISAIVKDEDQRGEPPFDLLPIVRSCSSIESKLDEFDPYLNDMSYPPPTITSDVIDRFHLTSDEEKRFWKMPGMALPVAACEAWCERRRPRDDSPVKHGERVFASTSFLRQVCSTLERSIIITVQIRRMAHSRSGDDSPSDYSIPASCKAFIFDAYGTLKDTRTDHQLG